MTAASLEWIYDEISQRSPRRPVDLSPDVEDLRKGLTSPLSDDDFQKVSSLLEKRARSVDVTTQPADYDVILTLFIVNANADDTKALTRLISQLQNEGRDYASVVLEWKSLNIIQGMTSMSVWQPWFVERFSYWSTKSGGPVINGWLGVLTTPELAPETKVALGNMVIEHQLGQFQRIMPEIVGLLVFDDPEWRNGCGPFCTPFRSIIDRTSEVLKFTDRPRPNHSTNP
jgi:hypothetical protein